MNRYTNNNTKKIIKYLAILSIVILFSWFIVEAISSARYRFAIDLKIDMDQRSLDGSHTITYVLDGGTLGANSPTTINSNQTVTLVDPTKTDYTFGGWYDNENFTGSSITTLSNVTHNVTLYAKWIANSMKIKYIYGNNVTFDGKTNYIDTDIALFSPANKTRDFEITMDIVSNEYNTGQGGNHNTFFRCADAASKPYSGFVFRSNKSGSTYRYILRNNLNTDNQVSELIYVQPTNPINKVHLVRTNNILYAEYNDSSTLTQVYNYTDLNKTFDYTLWFGADVDNKSSAFRFLKGELSNITVSLTYGSNELPITLPTPLRIGYIFKGWYADANYTQKIGNGGDIFSPLDNTNLYAKWKSESDYETESYTNDGNYVFDGTNYINTHMYLYSEENIDRNFEMSFDITNIGTNADNAVLMSATKNVLRLSDATNEVMSLETYGNAANGILDNIPNTTTNVRIIRIGNILYYSLNGGTFVQLNNYTGSTDYSDLPLTFGAECNANEDPINGFNGTLSNISVRYLSNSITIDDYNSGELELPVVYSHEGNYVFDGTNYIDTGIQLFSVANVNKDFEISFNIVSVDPASNGSQSTLVNSKYEVSPYPGFVYRMYTTGRVELTAAGTGVSGSSDDRSDITTVNSVVISRKNKKLYIKVNNEDEKQLYSFTNYTGNFSTPVTFGCSLTGSGAPFRYFVGTLSDMTIKLAD